MSAGVQFDWKELPGNVVVPFLGDTLKIVGNPTEYAQKRYESFGSVSKMVIFGQRSVLLLGPEANETVMKNKERVFSSVLAYEPFMKDIFPGTLGMKDFEDHSRHRRILQSAFHKKSLLRYLVLLNPITDQLLDGWRQNSQFRFLPVVKQLLLEQAAQLFLGQPLDDKARNLVHHFLHLAHGTTSIFRWNIPGMPYWRALRSKVFLQEFLQEQIAEKRANLTDDLFSHVCHAKSEEGEMLSEPEIVGHMLGLMSAAHDTNASTLCSMAYAFAKWPEIQNAAREEILSQGVDLPSEEHLKKLVFTGNVFREALRMWGPSHTMPRGTLKDFEYQGHAIPQGTMVYISPSFGHRMPEHWKDPDTFDPSRFSAPREEHKSHRYLFMPFGGGAHGCLGLILAEMQAKVFFWQLLKRFELRLVKPDSDYKLKYTPIPEPVDGLRVVIEPRD